MDFNVETMILALKQLYPDLRPSEWTPDESSPHGGSFQTRSIKKIGFPVDSNRYEWKGADYDNLSKTYGIIACSDGYFTFVPSDDDKMSPENLFWLEIYNFSPYTGFVPVTPEDITASARSLNEDNPESDGIGSLVAFMEDEEELSAEEMEFVKDFVHTSLLRALSDGIFDKHSA